MTKHPNPIDALLISMEAAGDVERVDEPGEDTKWRLTDAGMRRAEIVRKTEAGKNMLAELERIKGKK